MLELQVLRKKGSLKYFFIAIVYLLVIATFFFILIPQRQEVSTLNNAIADELNKHRSFTTVINQRPTAIQLSKEYQELIKDYESKIPQSYDLPVVLLSIHQLVNLAGLELNELQYSPMQKDSSAYWYPILLKVSGKYTQIYRFLQAFNTYLPSAKVSNAHLQSLSDQKVELNCKLNLYTATKFETTYTWKSPIWNLSNDHIRNGFGAPLSEMTEFYNGGLQLLGTIAHTDGHNYRALVGFQGKQYWKTVGSYIGIGQITSIQPRAITVDVNGFKVTISMGG